MQGTACECGQVEGKTGRVLVPHRFNNALMLMPRLYRRVLDGV